MGLLRNSKSIKKEASGWKENFLFPIRRFLVKKIKNQLQNCHISIKEAIQKGKRKGRERYGEIKCCPSSGNGTD